MKAIGMHQRNLTKTKLRVFDPKKRWSLVRNTVYFIVTLSHKVHKNNHPIKRASLIRSSSYVVLDVESDSKSSVNDVTSSIHFSLTQKTLTSMMKEKDLESLSNLGGVKHIASKLNIDDTLGLSSIDTRGLMLRKAVYGSNVYQRSSKRTFISFIIEAFKDTTIIILWLCACFSLGFGIKQHGPKEGWYDGGSIIIAIVLVVSVSAISNFKQSRQFDKFSKDSSNIPVEVLRDGHRKHISIFEVVASDIVFLKIGDQIPADGLFLDGHSLKLDESSMTGESDHVEINDRNNPFLFSGTKVTNGYGRMLVTSVGMNTAWGEMMSSINTNLNEETPLQMRLNKLTSWIGKIGLLVASLVLVVLFIRYFTGTTKDEHGNREFNGSKTKTDDVMNTIINIVSAAVTIVVVAIPEDLPLAVT